MKIFVDANILVSVLNKEYPLYTYTSRIISLANNSNFEIFTSAVCLAIAFYFAEKKSGSKQAKRKIKLICDHLRIADITESCVNRAANNPAILDFEDGLEYYAATESKCRHIITEDTKDFHFSDIPVSDSETFIKQYLLK